MQGHTYTDDRGANHKLCIEYAPYQAVPSDFQKKKNPREGTIEKGNKAIQQRIPSDSNVQSFLDPEYLAFVESLGKPKESKPTETQTTDEKQAGLRITKLFCKNKLNSFQEPQKSQSSLHCY